MKGRCGHEPAEIVARQPLFASLSIEECRSLVGRSLCRTVTAGQRIFAEGDECRGLHLIVEGAVRVYRANAEGQEQVLGVFGPGESLGEVALFDEGPYLASARASEESHLLFLPLAEVQWLYRTHPAVVHALVRELGWKIRRLVALVDRISLQDVPTRVAGALLRFAERAPVGGDGSFRLPCTQEELAAELGTTRESVARALRELRSNRMIRQNRSEVQLLDMEQLRRCASGRCTDGRAVRGLRALRDRGGRPIDA
jgi:CRP/FNR family transcriptional regulator, cyclic AMP receptor protein